MGVLCCPLKDPNEVVSGLSPRRSLVGSREEDMLAFSTVAGKVAGLYRGGWPPVGRLSNAFGLGIRK